MVAVACPAVAGGGQARRRRGEATTVSRERVRERKKGVGSVDLTEPDRAGRFDHWSDQWDPPGTYLLFLENLGAYLQIFDNFFIECPKIMKNIFLES